MRLLKGLATCLLTAILASATTTLIPANATGKNEKNQEHCVGHLSPQGCRTSSGDTISISETQSGNTSSGSKKSTANPGKSERKELDPLQKLTNVINAYFRKNNYPYRMKISRDENQHIHVTAVRITPTQHTKEADAAISAYLEMKLPKQQIKIHPDPANNEWNMLVVGLPIWLTTETSPTPTTKTTTKNGINLTLSATPKQWHWNMGDNTQITCTHMSHPTASTNPIQPSPDCGHTYQRKDTYTVTLTTTWQVNWETTNNKGHFTHTTPAETIQVQIGEATTLLVPTQAPQK